VIDLHLPPEEVDVNVHPAKAEVRLRNERAVFALVQRPIRRALSGLAPVGSDLPAGWPRPAPSGAAFSFGAASPPEVPLQSQLLPSEQAPEFEQAETPQTAGMPILRPLGQAGTTYVIAEGPAGLYLIDQHAAHERVLFERYLASLTGSAAVSQPLLAPVMLELTPPQAALVTSMAPSLQEHGFEVEPFGPGGYLLRAAPAGLRREDPARAFNELLDLLTREDSPADPRRRVAASLACHAAVRAGQTLATEEMRDLLQQLEACDTPQTCPHGRPTMLHLSADELARRFSRK
jgi:DNA mismatch repair protein MutL